MDESRMQDQISKSRLTFKYRLYPTKAQTAFLAGELREACSLYNAALEERIGAWKICRKSINLYDQQNQLPAMRADGCLTLKNAQCAQNVLGRVDRAFKNFFGRVKRGAKVGFPRFRSVRRYDSITYPQHPTGCRLLDNGRIRVHGAGHIKMKLSRPVEGTIKTSTIKREAGRWFVCFSVEREAQPLPVSIDAVGIDVGLTSFAVLSDGTEIRNPRHYRKAQARLRRCQRKVARRKKGGNRRSKAVQFLQRAHIHVRNQRSDFHHKLSRLIVNSFGLIAVEELNVKGLAGGMLAKSVHDAGWSQFFRFTHYKAENAGREFDEVDPRGTSQECVCGASVPKTLKNRWHSCSVCGREGPRDLISAQVILQRSLGNRASGANVETASCVSREAVY
jgi:putative transposase